MRDASPTASLLSDADLVVHEATYTPNDSNVRRWRAGLTANAETAAQTRDRAWRVGHSTPEGAATFAASVDAKLLVLTHFGRAVSGEARATAYKVRLMVVAAVVVGMVMLMTAPTTTAFMISHSQALDRVWSAARAHYDGEIVVAEELTRITLPVRARALVLVGAVVAGLATGCDGALATGATCVRCRRAVGATTRAVHVAGGWAGARDLSVR